MGVITNIEDLRILAERRVPRMFYDYADSGSWTESTYRANSDDFAKIKLRQRVAVNMENRSLASTMVGLPVAMPVAIAPTGLTGMQHADGEILAAKAAEKFGVPFTLSTMSICSIEDIAANTTAPFWFQVYFMKDRDFMSRLVERARTANCSALVLTLDLHVQGKRWADAKNGLSVPPRLTFGNTMDMLGHAGWLLSMAKSRRRTFGNLECEVQEAGNVAALSKWVEDQFDPSFDLDTVKWVRHAWDGKLILKGIMHPDDARQAVDVGADAIIVSNHGGRQLDSAPSSISVLPEIADAVRDRVEVLFDGGIRTGGDILKALGRGAHACLSGRACLYGLAAEGRQGVLCALKLLEQELKDAMALVGIRDLRQVDPGIVTAQPRL
jgi:L-lactate dehydrogenase (cytochrome)